MGENLAESFTEQNHFGSCGIQMVVRVRVPVGRIFIAHHEVAQRCSHEGGADGITVQGPTGEMVYANYAAALSMGYRSVEELLAAPPLEYIQRFELTDRFAGLFLVVPKISRPHSGLDIGSLANFGLVVKDCLAVA